jgi:putative PIN family toxin of toxin-antitoxin system
MKVFLDSNVLIAAYLSHGACYELYGHCLDRHFVFSSEFVRNEVLEKLVRKIRIQEEKAKQAYQHLCEHTLLVSEALINERICRDPDDDHIVAAALQAGADCIVSGDNDLLALKKVRGIPVISPRDFWKFEDLQT